jgi:chitodextrinase
MRRLFALAVFVTVFPTIASGAKPPPRPEPVPPQAPKEVAAVAATTTTITIAWSDSSDKGVVAYGVYRDGVFVLATKAKKATLDDLQCGHVYTLGVDAVDTAGIRSKTQATTTARTAACPVPPKPSAPKYVSVTAVTATTVSLQWFVAYDDRNSRGKKNRHTSATVTYGVYRDDVLVLTTTATKATVTGLECGHSYKFGVDAVDAAGNRSKQRTTRTVRTTSCPKPPSAPRNLTVTGVTATTVSLTWSPPDKDGGDGSDSNGSGGHDNGRTVEYGVYRDGVLVLTTTVTKAIVAGLECGRSYVFAVDAVNAAGNRSPKATTTAKTSACAGDVTPPTVPGNLTLAAANTTSISIAWTASMDDVGVVSYALFLGGEPAGSTTLTQATFAGLSCGQTYLFGVAAVDKAGNSSGRAELGAATVPCATTDLHVAPGGADYRWSFVAAVYDGKDVNLYVNGLLAASRPATGTMGPSGGPLHIGGNDIWGEWFSGQIDNVRVYSRALTETQLGADQGAPVTTSSPSPAPAGLVAAYSFDEGSGMTVTDASGNGNVGAISGATWTTGRYGGALSFNGLNNLVTVADANSLDLSTAMTLEAWVRPSELGETWRTAIIKQTGTTPADRLVYALYANTETGQPSGHVFVGSDTWARGGDGLPVSDCRTASAPCLSFDRAYHSALPGQVVQVAGGTYPAQTLLYDAAKESATQHVVFQPEPGASVKIDGNINVSDHRFVKGASHVTFRDMTLTGDVNLEGCGVPDGQQCPPDQTAGSNDLTFQNLRVKGSFAFVCHSCSNVEILGGTWGPDSYLPCSGSNHPEVSPASDGASSFVKLKRPNHILIDGARFQNFARCLIDDHTECLQFEPADYVTIRNSVFTKCDTITLAFFDSLAGDSKSPAGYAAPDHIVLENNFIDQSYDATGGPTYNGLQFNGCTNCVIRNNSWAQNTHLPCCGDTSVNNVVVGNLGPQLDCGDGGITFSHNVFQGVACGPTDKDVADLGFVDLFAFDLHVLVTSPAIDAGDPANFPATDIFGRLRPLGLGPDAGAQELR